MRSIFQTKSQKRAAKKRRDESNGLEHDDANHERYINSKQSVNQSQEIPDISEQLERIEQQNQIMITNYNEIKSQYDVIISHLISIRQHLQIPTSTASVKLSPALRPSTSPHSQRPRPRSSSQSKAYEDNFVSRPPAHQAQNTVAKPTYTVQTKPSLLSRINFRKKGEVSLHRDKEYTSIPRCCLAGCPSTSACP